MVDDTRLSKVVTYIHHSINYTIFDTKWIPSSARFVVLGSLPRGTGVIQIYSLNKGKIELETEIEKRSPFKCGTFSASSLEDRNLATGDWDGYVSIWDLEASDQPVYHVKGHEGIVNAIDGCAGLGVGVGAPELVTGSRDGTVKVWDPRQEGVPVAIFAPGEGQTPRDCWAVAFGNSFCAEERVVAAGYENGDVKMFDLRMNAVRWEANVRNGVVDLQFDRKDIEMNKLLVSCLESKFRVYDLRTQHPTEGCAYVEEKGNESTVWIGRHSPFNRDVFVAGYGSGALDLYKYCYPVQRSRSDELGQERGIAGTLEKVGHESVSTQPINSFDWHPDKEGLCVMGSFDQSIRVCFVTRMNTL